ncbi:CAP domain-containing protein [Streptomyces sp. NPDC050738]|uniref:CAP domain-containing protein n=1 Tax=Streptomyces sp. NPDC050738 TaxID=3154744 RepID=UPI003416E44F
MKRVVRAAVMAAGAGLLLLLPAQVLPAQASAARAYYPDVDRIVCEMNKERATKHLPALRISDRASEVARAHAKDMSRTDSLTSVGSDGRDLRDRLNDAGLYSPYVSEYMFSGYRHDGYFTDMATDPDPHNGFYKVLMSKDPVAIGIGYDDSYWDVDLLGPHRRLVTRAATCTP